MKGSYFGLWSPQQQFDMHARSKNTFIVLYNMHYFLPYLLNDSQRFAQQLIFKQLLCLKLICSDWSDWSHFNFIMPVMPDKAVCECSAALCTALPWNSYFTAPKAAPSGKEWISIFIQTNRKRPTSGRAICYVSCWRQHEKATCFNDSESTLSFEKQ